MQGRPEEAIAEFEAVLAFDRNSTNALFQLGWCKAMTGSLDEVIPLAEQLIRLSPRDPTLANWYVRIGWVHLLQSRRSTPSELRCFFKHTHVYRIVDKYRGTLVYVAISDKIIEGSPQNSISTVPIIPWKQ